MKLYKMMLIIDLN